MKSHDNIFKYGYANEKLTSAIYFLACLDEGVDAPTRFEHVLSEISLLDAKEQISQDSKAKNIYNEIFSLIDFSKRQTAIPDMPQEVRFYMFRLFIELYNRINELYHGRPFLDMTRSSVIVNWIKSIKLSYEEYKKGQQKKN